MTSTILTQEISYRDLKEYEAAKIKRLGVSNYTAVTSAPAVNNHRVIWKGHELSTRTSIVYVLHPRK